MSNKVEIRDTIEVLADNVKYLCKVVAKQTDEIHRLRRELDKCQCAEK
jgi:hypothetical protein